MIRALALLALAACSKDSTETVATTGSARRAIDAPSKGAELMATFEPMVEKLCACKDRRCAKPLSDAFEAAMQREIPLVQNEAGVGAALGQLAMKAQSCTWTTLYIAEMPSEPIVVTTNADEMITYAYKTLATERSAIVDISIDYVQADGTVPPKYGRVTIPTGRRKPPAPADDPDRPIGAPISETPLPTDEDTTRLQCAVFVWAGATPAITTMGCRTDRSIPRPRCRVTEIWARAIKDQAPATGLAKLSVYPASGSAEQYWGFQITDTARKVQFSRYYNDDCATAVERE